MNKNNMLQKRTDLNRRVLIVLFLYGAIKFSDVECTTGPMTSPTTPMTTKEESVWSTTTGTTTKRPKTTTPPTTPAMTVWTTTTPTTPAMTVWTTTEAESVWSTTTGTTTRRTTTPPEIVWTTTEAESVWSTTTGTTTRRTTTPPEIVWTTTEAESVWSTTTGTTTRRTTTPPEIVWTTTEAESVWSTTTTTTTNPTTPTQTTTPITTSVVTTTTAAPPTTTTPALPSTGLGYAKLLIETFLSDIDVRVIPVNNKSNPIQIKTYFVPVSLLEFDTSTQKFSILGYIRVVWYEETISWDIADYGGIKHMVVPSTSVWRPTITIHKPYDGNGLVGNKLTDRIRIGRSGHIQWVPDGTYNVVCDVDIRYYPFDEQICKIVYYAAGESIDRVELNHVDEVRTEGLEKNENSAWRIHKVERNKYIVSNNYHIEIIFHLSRRPNYAMYTLIVPLLMLSALNVCMFLVPIESGEKGGFAITIFLSYGIYISILSDKLPHNSVQTSFFIVFITLLLVFSVLSVLYSVIEAKLVVSIGAKQSLFGCFVSLNKCCKSGQNSDEPDKKSQTWSEFFRILDMIIFAVYIVFVAVSTVTFFCLMFKQISKDRDWELPVIS